MLVRCTDSYYTAHRTIFQHNFPLTAYSKSCLISESLKWLVYLKACVTERLTDWSILHLLVQCPLAEARSLELLWVSHMADRAQTLGPSFIALPGTLNKKLIWSKVAFQAVAYPGIPCQPHGLFSTVLKKSVFSHYFFYKFIFLNSSDMQI